MATSSPPARRSRRCRRGMRKAIYVPTPAAGETVRASTRFVRGSAYAPDFFVLRTLY